MVMFAEILAVQESDTRHKEEGASQGCVVVYDTVEWGLQVITRIPPIDLEMAECVTVREKTGSDAQKDIE